LDGGRVSPPAIYHFTEDGALAARYVPEGSNNEETGMAVGEEAFPAIYAQRRANRGFEAVALRDGILYAFIQSPIDNPDGGKDNSSKAATLVRILAFDTTAKAAVGEYFYRLDGEGVDKIGDAVVARRQVPGDGARRRHRRRGAQAASITSTSTPPPTSWAMTCPSALNCRATLAWRSSALRRLPRRWWWTWAPSATTRSISRKGWR
jgi:hypothetical protein